MPSRILVYEVVEQHGVFYSWELKVEMVLKECNVKLCVMKYYSLFVEKRLKKLFSFFVKAVCCDICSSFAVVKKEIYPEYARPEDRAQSFQSRAINVLGCAIASRKNALHSSVSSMPNAIDSSITTSSISPFIYLMMLFFGIFPRLT